MSALPPAIVALLDGGTLDGLLRRVGHAPVDPGTVAVLAGRNNNFSARTTAGEPLFVKQFEAAADASPDGDSNLAHALAFEQYRDQHTDGLARLGAPRLIGCDHDLALAVYELLPGVRTCAELADDGALDATHLSAAGSALAALHEGPAATGVPDRRHRLPPLGAFAAIGLRSWSVASAAELEAWSLLQSDRELSAGVRRLRRDEDDGEQTPIHGDLRLDQVLVSERGVHVTDFEDFRLGDPARDVGSLLGELAYRAILAIVKDRDASFTIDVEFTHEEIVERGAREMDNALPLLQAFWAGYRGASGRNDPELANRAVAWLGWHMFDRLLAASKDRNKLLSVHRAAAGIGRAVLLSPHRYVQTFGLAR